MNKKLKIVIIVSLVVIFFVGVVLIVSNRNSGDGPSEIVAEGEKITSETSYLSLENYETNLSIVEPGSYILAGNLDNSIIVDANGPVTLALNTVKISSSTAAIINKTDNPLELILIQDSVNEIYGGSNKKYRAAIYSVGNITISGSKGGLITGGKLSSTTPIYSNGNIELSSGTVIMLGKSPISVESMSIATKYVSFELDDVVSSDHGTSILNGDGDVMCSFSAGIDYKNLLLASDDLEDKKHFLSVDGEIKKSGIMP